MFGFSDLTCCSQSRILHLYPPPTHIYTHTPTPTQGTITDDSDVFLFGGQEVYLHFFSQDKNMESYSSKNIETRQGEEEGGGGGGGGGGG